MLEDNPRYRFDLSGMAGPRQVREDLGEAVQAWSASPKGGRRVHGVVGIRKGLSAFLRWVDWWNQEHDGAPSKQVLGVVDLTPFHLRHFHSHLESRYRASTIYNYYGDTAVLLRFARQVSKETRREAVKRKGDGPPPVRPVQRYTEAEFSRLRNGARKVVVAAHGRITAAHSLAREHGNVDCEDPVRAGALHEVLLHGRPQSREGMLALGATVGAVEKGGGTNAARRHLFLGPDEAFAAVVLLACQRGLNLSPIVTAPPPTLHEAGIIQLDLDKPRRGPSARFWPEIFVDDENVAWDEGGKGAETVRLIAEMTGPARQYLSNQGKPAERLLIYWSDYRAEPNFGLPTWNERKKSAWTELAVDFRRLRRSVPGQGVAKEPTDHNQDTYLHYVRSDPEALAQSQEDAATGVQKLLDLANATLAVRLAADEDTNPETDSVVVNCADPQNRPDTGTPCTTGFYSFLDCLDCGNAATVRRLLPRQIAALRVLEELRDAIGTSWEQRFAPRYYKLVALTQRHTAAELEEAAKEALQHVPIILSALRQEVPNDY